MNDVATPEGLFRAYFWPLYPPDVQADLAAARATDANPAQNPSIFAHLDEAARVFAGRRVVRARHHAGRSLPRVRREPVRQARGAADLGAAGSAPAAPRSAELRHPLQVDQGARPRAARRRRALPQPRAVERLRVRV